MRAGEAHVLTLYWPEGAQHRPELAGWAWRVSGASTSAIVVTPGTTDALPCCCSPPSRVGELLDERTPASAPPEAAGDVWVSLTRGDGGLPRLRHLRLEGRRVVDASLVTVVYQAREALHSAARLHAWALTLCIDRHRGVALAHARRLKTKMKRSWSVRFVSSTLLRRTHAR